MALDAAARSTRPRTSGGARLTVSWAMGTDLKTRLVLDAMNMASVADVAADDLDDVFF